MTMTPPTFFRLALRLLPAAFRQRHEREMEQYLASLLADKRGLRRATTYLRAITDVAFTAPALQLRALRARAVAPSAHSTENASMNGSLRRDLSYAIRGLSRNPGFACAAVLTLALGLGAATTIFSVVNGVLMRPLPYMTPDRIVNIWVDFGVGGQSLPAVSVADFVDYKAK